ncbi:NADH-quinone oxidoreductase subunit M [Candidatus Legionella polyplacis]|uniref:NADH-quinone oxidoreductase subunit M n=1 Tax=Candidatus Legionella polyplacis TaxID=2005262 RepID=A0ABZ2H0R4_9GAMM
MHCYCISFLIWIPILSGLLFLYCSKTNFFQSFDFRYIWLLIISFTFFITIYMLFNFDLHTFEMQYIEEHLWIPSLNIRYSLGVDGLSMSLIVLSEIIIFISVLSIWNYIENNISEYLSYVLVIQGLLIGIFTSLDAILFYIFWESILIPFYLIIGIWGSKNRSYAAIKFFIYTFLGSIFMLLVFIYIGQEISSFKIKDFYLVKLSIKEQILIFISFFLAFAVKVPIFPFHTWLPDVHTEASSGGSILLSAILLKVGIYGLLRFLFPIVPDACNLFAKMILLISLFSIIYISIIAYVQEDLKCVIAYSSILHMSLVVLGLFSTFLIIHRLDNIKYAGFVFEGSVFIMFSHAFISSAMFSNIGYLYERLHTRKIKDFGGIARVMPLFSFFFMFFSISNLGMPGTSGFVGEFMVILGSMKAGFWLSIGSGIILILGVSYTLRVCNYVVFGSIANYKIKSLYDLSRFEKISNCILFVFILILGIYPNILLKYIHNSINVFLVKENILKI